MEGCTATNKPPHCNLSERLFSGASILLDKRRRQLGMDIIEANEGLREQADARLAASLAAEAYHVNDNVSAEQQLCEAEEEAIIDGTIKHR
jgi:hypothetical protein